MLLKGNRGYGNDLYLKSITEMMKRNQRRIASPIKQVMFPANKRLQANSLVAPEKQKTKLDFSWVSLLTLGITVFTAVVFGAGKAYRQHYLASFGFSDTVMPWAFQDVVYLGIVKQLPILLVAPMWGIGAVFGLVVLSGVLLWIGARLAAQRKKKSGDRKQTDSISSTDFWLVASEFALNCFGAILLIGVLAVFFVATAERLGSADAKAAIASVAQGSKEKPQLSYVTIERLVGGQKIVDAGYLFSCSERMCGLYSPEKGNEASRLVPLDSVTSFRYRN